MTISAFATVRSRLNTNLSASINGAEVSVFSHATEDEAKVRKAVFNLVHEEYSKSGLATQGLTGHYNDPLVLMTLKIVGRKDTFEAFKQIMEKLSTQDRLRLLDEAGDRVDEAGNLYVRLDKQRAFGGVAVLNDPDPIRVKFKFRIPHGSDPAVAVRSFILNVIGEIEGVSKEEDKQ